MSNRSQSEGMSRRAFIKASGSAVAMSIAAPVYLRGGVALAAGGEIVFGANGGSTQTLFETVFIPKFTRETGIKVTYVPGQPADLVAKLRAQGKNAGLDVIWLAGAVTYIAVDEKLLLPFDPALIANAARIDPKIAREPAILPVAVSGNALTYRKDVYAKRGWTPPASWMDLWDPRFKGGHAGMYGMSVTGGVEMLLQVARELTGDYNKLEPAFEKFKALRPNIYDFFPTAGAWETAMQQGGLWIAVNSYTRAMQLEQAGMPIGTVLPHSGVPSHYLCAGIAQGARNVPASHAWVNWLLSPDVQKLMVAHLGYAPATSGVEIPANIRSFIPDSSLAWFPDWRAIGARFDSIVQQWQRVVER